MSNWELIEDATEVYPVPRMPPVRTINKTERMKVPGGWLYKHTTNEGTSTTFVPEEEL